MIRVAPQRTHAAPCGTVAHPPQSGIACRRIGGGGTFRPPIVGTHRIAPNYAPSKKRPFRAQCGRIAPCLCPIWCQIPVATHSRARVPEGRTLFVAKHPRRAPPRLRRARARLRKRSQIPHAALLSSLNTSKLPEHPKTKQQHGGHGPRRRRGAAAAARARGAPRLTAEQQAVMQQQQAAALAAQQQQFYYAADPNMPNPYYAGGVPMYAANYGYYGGPPVMYPGYAPTLLPPAGDAPQRTRRRRRGSARGRRGGRRDGDNGDAAAADENGDASPRAAPAETPAFSAADFPSLGVATGIKEPAQQWVTPAAPVTAQTLGQEPPAAVAAAQAAPAVSEPPKPPPPPHKPKDGRKCGVCAWFEPSKKMGFIRQDEGGDIFVHASDLRDGVSIEEGDRVEYAVAQFKDRNKAIDVVPISQIVSTTPEEDASDGTQEEEVPVFDRDGLSFPRRRGAARGAGGLGRLRGAVVI